MKSKFLVSMLVAFVLNGCERKSDVLQNELSVIERTSKDTSQPHYIRKSALTFAKILNRENNVKVHDWRRGFLGIRLIRNETTISTSVAFLKAIETMLPDKLPAVETYIEMQNKAGSAEIIEYNVGQLSIMMSNSISNITLYNDPDADMEVDGVFKRLEKKYEGSETGKKILEYLRGVRENASGDRANGIKPWEALKPPGYAD